VSGMNPRDADDLQSRDHPVKEDMVSQCKVWRFERLGWYALLGLMGLTLAGLFSKGPLSTQEVRSVDGTLRVDYQRFLRNGSSDGLAIHLKGKAHETLEVEISGDLLRGFSIETLQPQPLKASTFGGGVKLWVLSDNDGQSLLHLMLHSEGVGTFNTRVSQLEGASVRFSQFIYP